MLFGFDAFGDDFQAHLVRHHADGLQQEAVVGLGGEGVDEGLAGLEVVDGELVEAGEGGVAGVRWLRERGLHGGASAGRRAALEPVAPGQLAARPLREIQEEWVAKPLLAGLVQRQDGERHFFESSPGLGGAAWQAGGGWG